MTGGEVPGEAGTSGARNSAASAAANAAANAAQSKAELRAGFLAARQQRGPEEIASAREAVRGHVLERAGQWRRVAAFVPLRTEPGSPELLAALSERGIEVLVPALRPDLDLDWHAWPDGPPLGPEAVTGVDAVLVPAVAVSRGGVRLGRGGGSYDRALSRITHGTPVVALVFSEEIVPELPADGWDRPVTAAVTPAGWFDLDG